jgi:hypothetical protein
MKDNFDLYEWNKNRYLISELDINRDDEIQSLNISHGGDDPKIGAELESDKNVVGENKEFLEDLADRLSSKVPNLRFKVSDFDDIRVYGSQRDLADFGRKYHGQQYRGYEVFAVDDDDRGETVRIVKSDSILRKEIKETLHFIKENNPEFTNEEIKAELKEIKVLGKQLNEKLCPKGEAYRKRRMAAGEKSSAYLSGRAVKVCNGTMSGKKKKK